MKVIDTSVAVDYLRGLPESLQLLDRLVSEDRLCTSEVVRFELLAGAREGEIDALEAFFSALLWIPVDAEIAREAGRLARLFRKAHSGIDAADYFIAGTALVLDADLLTTDVRHFPMLERVRPAY